MKENTFDKDDLTNGNWKKNCEKDKVEWEHVTKGKNGSENVKEMNNGREQTTTSAAIWALPVSVHETQGCKRRLKIQVNIEGKKEGMEKIVLSHSKKVNN